MNDTELRLKCLGLANGSLEHARQLYDWAKEASPAAASEVSPHWREWGKVDYPDELDRATQTLAKGSLNNSVDKPHG